MPVVTISASYGSGGSEVAPALARRLGVKFVDRVVSPETAHRLAHAENDGLFWRLIRSVTPAGGLTAGSIHAERELHERFHDRESLEAALRGAAADGDVVILGRAGALVLRDDPRAVHVRLDGPSEARVFRAIEIESIDEATARQRLAGTDRARALRARHLRLGPGRPRALHARPRRHGVHHRVVRGNHRRRRGRPGAYAGARRLSRPDQWASAGSAAATT